MIQQQYLDSMEDGTDIGLMDSELTGWRLASVEIGICVDSTLTPRIETLTMISLTSYMRQRSR